MIQSLIAQLRPYSKGIAAAIAGALVAWLMKHNIIIADDLSDAIEVILGAIITGLVVFLSPRNVEVKK
jgi:hypothetical protein